MTASIFDFDASLPTRLYWDANFLVNAAYPAGRYHQECSNFLTRLSDIEETLSYVSALTLDETIFTLLRLKVQEDYPEQGFWDVYRQQPEVIKPHLEELQMLVNRLFVDPRTQVVGVEAEFINEAIAYMNSYSFLPRDALHLTAMARYDIESIVTTDSDFLAVDGLQIYTCNPKILSQG